MTERTRIVLVGTFVVLVHAVAGWVLVPPGKPALHSPTTQTVSIGLSAPAPAPEPRSSPVRTQKLVPTVAPGLASTTATEGLASEAPSDGPVPSSEPSGSASDPPEGPPTSTPTTVLPTPPRVSTQEVLARLVYPPLALRRRLEATVVLDLVIDEQGAVTPTVVEDPGYGFAEAAVRAFRGLVAAPALADGKPVVSRLRYPVHFVLP